MMGSAIGLRADFDGLALRRLARASKSANQARRLLALAEIYDGKRRTDAARIGGVGLQIVRDWVVRFNARGPEGLLDGKAPGNQPRLNDAQRQALAAIVESGPIPAIHGVVRWRLADLVGWLWTEFAVSLDETTVGRELKKLGYVKLSARPRHHAQNEDAMEAFKKGGLVHSWQRSKRPLPLCNTQTMSLHLEAISRVVASGSHAVVLMDQAGWHMTGKLDISSNITIIALPAKCPELNPVENVWQFMRDNWLSNRIFTSYDNIVDHCCEAWNKRIDQPNRIMTIDRRSWAHAS
jgi:transposase